MSLKGNVVRHQKGNSSDQPLEVLDDSLVNYGWNPGDIVSLQEGTPPEYGIPVWELEGQLHARQLERNSGGWAQAYTPFLTAGKICYSLHPAKVEQIKEVGWIGRR